MARFDNPAGRLHEILRIYQGTDVDQDVRHGWARALNCTDEQLVHRMGAVVDLFDEVILVAQLLDLTMWPELDHVEDDIRTLHRSLFKPDMTPTTPFHDALVDEVPMRGLGALSLHLSRYEPQCSLEPTERVELLDELNELSRSVRASDIDATIKRLMLQRIQQMIRALDALEIVGAEGVQLAAESLLATVVIDGAESPNQGLMDRAAKVAKRAIVAVGAAGALSGNLIAVDDLAQRLLDAGSPPAQLNPGPPMSQDAPSDAPRPASGAQP